jgi:hypothetical protein
LCPQLNVFFQCNQLANLAQIHFCNKLTKLAFAKLASKRSNPNMKWNKQIIKIKIKIKIKKLTWQDIQSKTMRWWATDCPF